MLEGGYGGGAGVQGDTDLMTGAGTDADSGATDLDTMLTNLMNQIEPAMTEWQGKGGQTFQDVRESCEAEMRRLNGALRRLGKKIGDNSIMYVNVDDEISTLVGNAGAEAGSITHALCDS